MSWKRWVKGGQDKYIGSELAAPIVLKFGGLTTESTTTNPRGFEVVLQWVKDDLVIWVLTFPPLSLFLSLTLSRFVALISILLANALFAEAVYRVQERPIYLVYRPISDSAVVPYSYA